MAQEKLKFKLSTAGPLSAPFSPLLPLFLLCLSLSNANGASYGVWKTGAKATYYGGADASGTWGGACGYGNLMQTPMKTNVAAGSPSLFINGQGCGSCYQVRCVGSPHCITGKSINVTVTDVCWGCAGTHFDLSQPAFGSIAKLVAGVVNLEYRRIPCKYSSKVAIQVTQGSNNWWFQILVRNQGGAGDISSVQVKRAKDNMWFPMTKS